MEFLPYALRALDSFKQFIVYVLVPSKTREGKMDKLPINYKSKLTANAHDPEIWLTAESAIAYAAQFGPEYGVGFVFTEDDPFWFLDIDDCLLPCGTQWSELAISLMTAFNGAAVEISSSNRGLHIIGTGVSPTHACRNSHYNLEFYTSGRFVALTGTGAMGNAATDFSGPVLNWLVENYFPASANPAYAAWTDTPVEQWNGPTDDVELVNRALRSQSARAAFGSGASFRDLWERNESVLSRIYPHNDKAYDESRADAALAQHLAFWTGNNCERIRSIMQQSGLRRDKWERPDYLPQTILGACGKQKEWLRDKPIQDNAGSAAIKGLARATRTDNTAYLAIDQQIDLFQGCVYIQDEHRVLIPGGYCLNPERFRVAYGGFSMPMDTRNEKVSRNAWEVFTESQAFRAPRADSSCFKPDLPPGQIIERDGQTYVNTWWPAHVVMTEGDVTPFLKHLSLLCPVPEDAMYLLCYMAASVQHQGVKFQWCPVIQGVEGNGKTLLTRCVAYAISRRYTHFPKASELTSRFNDYLYQRTFIAIEDIYVPDQRMEVMECMKPMVTNEFLEIEPKNGTKVTREVCANFIINTNHRDGLRKHRSDRRFAPFFTAQQCVDDLLRAGMDADYFTNLYDWLYKRGGFAAVAYYLNTFVIPDNLNPARGCQRAPITSSTTTAISQSLGSIEQEIMECVGQQLPGFRRGWISSIYLDRLLERLHATRRIPLNKRKELMESLDYIHHPGLTDGRVNNTVMPDNGKPRLYIRIDHQHRHLTGGAVIAKAYEDDQK